MTPKPQSALAELETALRVFRAYGCLADTHAHRAVQEDSLRVLQGRDALTADWAGKGPQSLRITADLGEMIGFAVEADGRAWRGHRWVWREDGRVVREVVVEDSGLEREAPADHPPLGELRAGTGQFGAGSAAILPPDFHPSARGLADRLHRAWNGRAFDLYSGEWLTRIVQSMPDATFHFERAICLDAQTAILWRVHGHHQNGQRVRLIGSSVMGLDADDSLLDHAAMAAQLRRKVIDYSKAG